MNILRNKYFIPFAILILIFVILHGCDTTTGPEDTRPVGLYGTVVDPNGNLISDVHLHYIFNPGTDLEIQNMLIPYSLPYTQNVTVKVYDIYDSLVATLIDQEEQQSGMYQVHFNDPVTNGIYYFEVQKGDTLESGTFFIRTEDITVLKGRTPLLQTDQAGEFHVEPFVFGIGETIMDMTISASISIVLTKSDHNTLVESFILDTTQAVDMEFTLYEK